MDAVSVMVCEVETVRRKMKHPVFCPIFRMKYKERRQVTCKRYVVDKLWWRIFVND